MKKSISLVFVLFVSVAVCAGAFATDYYIEDYNVDVEVGNNAVHSVQETLQFNFQNPRHGFYREIPYDYTDYSGVEARITDLSCSDPYETERSNGYLVMTSMPIPTKTTTSSTSTSLVQDGSALSGM